MGILYTSTVRTPLVIIYSYYRKYAVPLFLGHPV